MGIVAQHVKPQLQTPIPHIGMPKFKSQLFSFLSNTQLIHLDKQLMMAQALVENLDGSSGLLNLAWSRPCYQGHFSRKQAEERSLSVCLLHKQSNKPLP